MDKAHFLWRGDTLLLYCHLQPGAKRSEFAGLFARPNGDRLKIRIQAPPMGGKANGELIRFLAAAYGVARAEVEISQGLGSRQKTVTIFKPRVIPAECLITAARP